MFLTIRYIHQATNNNDRCRMEWQYVDIRKLGTLNDDERKYFESKISENYSLRALGAQECPKVR